MALGKISNSSNTSRKIILLYFGKKKKKRIQVGQTKIREKRESGKDNILL
jgi:hypothetical protein